MSPADLLLKIANLCSTEKVYFVDFLIFTICSRHYESEQLFLDDSPSGRPHFNPAAEPLLLVDSGIPVTRRASACPSHASNLSVTAPHTPDNNGMGAEAQERPKGLIESFRSYPTSVFFILGNEFCERFRFVKIIFQKYDY